MMITTYCNQRCSFCYIGRKAKPVHRSLEQIQLELSWARGQYNGDCIVLSGGEPTLHPQISDIMDVSKNLGFSKITLFTNAQQLRNRNLVDHLVQHGLHGAMISLHGSQAAIHNRLVCRQHFEDVLKGIENALNASIEVTINTVATTFNLNDVGSIYHLLQDKFPNILDYRITYPALMGEILKHHELIPNYQDVAAQIFSLLGESNCVPLTCELIPLCLLKSAVKTAMEYNRHRGIDFIFNDIGSQYNRVGGKPCLRCQFRDCCYGLQFDAVLRHGIPSSYGKINEEIPIHIIM